MFGNMTVNASRKIGRMLGALPFVPGRHPMSEFWGPWMSTETRYLDIVHLPGKGQLKVERDWAQRQMYLGIYETNETRSIKNFLRAGNVFIDAGANIGYYTVMGAAIVGDNGKVYSFEAIPWIDSILSVNVAINQFTNVVINEGAVSSSLGTAGLYLSEIGVTDGAASVVS